ncbi:MAG: hypothetical protein KGN02_02315 [bacterium]|nr:hypothetical protein [bacterium]
MYATVRGFDELAARRDSMTRTGVPYCFILDEAYHVVMAGPSGGSDPLAPLYHADSQADVLPGPIDRVVRALTATWRSSRAASSATAAVSDLQVTVAPLHGNDGRRIAVFVQRGE